MTGLFRMSPDLCTQPERFENRRLPIGGLALGLIALVNLGSTVVALMAF
jgi:hypothetical protein